MQDVGERKKAEHCLRKLRAALELSNDAIAIFDVGDDAAGPTFEYVNPAFSRMFGHESDDATGKSLDILRAVGDEGSLTEDLRLTLNAENSYSRQMINRRRDGSELLAEWRVTRVRDDAGQIKHWVAVIRDMTEKQSFERALRYSEQVARKQFAELETLYDTAPIGLAMFSKELRFVRVNGRMAEFSGIAADQHIGRTPRQILPALADQAEPLLRKVFSTGKPILGIEIVGETPKAPGVLRTWRAHFYPVVLDNAIEAVGVVVEEITEQKRAEKHLQLVMRELNHRVKNSLAVVQSIASQTLRSSSSVAHFEEALIGRIRALADIHTLLAESNWQSAKMSEIVREAVRPYRLGGVDAVVISGPELSLTPSAALAFSMVLHELTTNAWKYGALSRPGGTVTVHWSIPAAPANGQLFLKWTETGGPQLTARPRPGFGGQLIDFTISHEFGGTASIDYTDAGVVCDIAIPWRRISLDDPPTAPTTFD